MSQEVVFSHKTRGNSSPKDKPRVYFTCHPDDFERYFEKICEDIFKTHDCTVYYTDDMNADLSDENNLVDLERMNLFVIPVTFRLLTQPNRAMDSDFRFAMGKHIPVLPMMMEPGIDEFYSKPDKFDELQYINPYSHDLTEISYEEKLKKYLESVLISDELARRVRKTFDAYIFLSYRKKDRAYANKLMKLIHNNPECGDIAIWFDEFLTPGESFKDNIDRILQDSKLFTLLVTPNLLEKPEGKPNFVMEDEYPAAVKAGIIIVPIEMISTDKEALKECFNNIPECIGHCNEEKIKNTIIESIGKTNNFDAEIDSEHLFLIGIAYLDGIDVETDVEKGVLLIKEAAEHGSVEAMEKLFTMYSEGDRVNLDYHEALKWIIKESDYCIDKYGEDAYETLRAFSKLSTAYSNCGEYKKALEISERIGTYSDERDLLYAGSASVSLAHSFLMTGDYSRTIEICNNALEKNIDMDARNVLSLLILLADAYTRVGNKNEALKIYSECYELANNYYGSEHRNSLAILNNMADIYFMGGDYKKAYEINMDVYQCRLKTSGNKHPETLVSVNNIANIFMSVNMNKEAYEALSIAYNTASVILGEEHPSTLSILNNLAVVCGSVGKEKLESDLSWKVFKLRRKVLGDNHPDTIISLSNLALVYSKAHLYEQAESLLKDSIRLKRECKGYDGSFLLPELIALSTVYYESQNYRKEVDILEEAYSISCVSNGNEHYDTLKILSFLFIAYDKAGDHDVAVELGERAYEQFLCVYGPDNENTIIVKENLDRIKGNL